MASHKTWRSQPSTSSQDFIVPTIDLALLTDYKANILIKLAAILTMHKLHRGD